MPSLTEYTSNTPVNVNPDPSNPGNGGDLDFWVGKGERLFLSLRQCFHLNVPSCPWLSFLVSSMSSLPTMNTSGLPAFFVFRTEEGPETTKHAVCLLVQN